jgi:tetrahydromethanopterin S-methyltransferase subunit G
MRSEVVTVLTEKLGPEGFDALDQMIEEKVRQIGVTKDEYREILSRLDLLEHGYRELKGEVTELRREIRLINERLDSLNERFDSLRSEMYGRFDSLKSDIYKQIDSFRSEMYGGFDSLRSEINSLRTEMNGRIDMMLRWTVGTVAFFGILISALMAILKLFG